ncbi:MAG: CRISPR system precrRNA processing endoribonuclease RAMP protein Cas6 [Phycisphaerales bacterium]|nr:CRISPR system precrRNA processing endoribonuclease RAMP protein Cas6 [Phycisphaerales bacterium]MCB9855319.1 CRISPR system precrRNA processing endoribonuclease RAMP protein Cas6 [Phycisphaerales bacterium]MCB9862912.1 CRISPR system precrRNA processing endoribonuclease RAMP protein Cas6 [Phycisphaerales bacterium]
MRKYPSIPQPMVVRVSDLDPRKLNVDETLDFGFRLFGGAIDFFPYLVYSVARIGEMGLGADDFRFEILSVSDGDKVIYQPDQRDQLLEPLRRQIYVVEEPETHAPSDLSLRLLTPLRLRSNGRINQSPTLIEILKAALRRLRIMSHFYGDKELCPENVGALLDEASSATPIHQNLRAISVHRTSTRQNRKMALNAVVGSVDYQLASTRLVPWLRAASECHIGKAASFGFGRVVCEVTKR